MSKKVKLKKVLDRLKHWEEEAKKSKELALENGCCSRAFQEQTIHEALAYTIIPDIKAEFEEDE